MLCHQPLPPGGVELPQKTSRRLSWFVTSLSFTHLSSARVCSVKELKRQYYIVKPERKSLKERRRRNFHYFSKWLNAFWPLLFPETVCNVLSLSQVTKVPALRSVSGEDTLMCGETNTPDTPSLQPCHQGDRNRPIRAHPHLPVSWMFSSQIPQECVSTSF